MTKKRLMEKLDEAGISSVIANRIGALMDKFVTPDAFFAAGKGELLKQWHDMGNERDLGNNFFEGFDKALAIWKTPDEGVITPPQLRKFSRDDLKNITDMMELLGIPAMDAGQMASVLDMRNQAPAGKGVA